MKTILVSARKKTLRDLLEQASSENLVLMTGDGREFILAEVDSFDHEIELTRQNQALMQWLDARGREHGTVSLAEARSRLLTD